MKGRISLLLIISCFIAVMLPLTLTRFYGFKTSLLDLADYTQIFWNFTQRGEFLHTMPPPFIEQHAFAYHFTPFFYLLAPLMTLFPDAQTLQIFQVFAFAAAAIPVFFATRALGWSEQTAAVWAAIFLINPFTLNATIWDFHETAVSTFSMACILWAIAAKRRIAMLAFCLLLLSCKEHFGLSVAGAGLLWAWRTGEKRLGAAMVAFGLLSVWVLLRYVIPSYTQGNQLYMMNGTGVEIEGMGASLDRFGWLLDPLNHLDVAGKLIFSALSYALLLLASVMGLPLLAPLWLLPGIADFAVNSSSTADLLRSPVSYHSAPLIPVLVVAASAGLRRLPKFGNFSRKELLGLVMLFAATLGWLYGPLPLPGSLDKWEVGNIRFDYPEPDRRAIADILPMVEGKVIAVQNNIGSVFSHRRGLYMFPYKDEVDAIVLRLEFPYTQKYRTLAEPVMYRHYQRLMASGQWGITYWNPPWLVMERNPATRLDVGPEIDKAWNVFLHDALREAHERSR